MVSSRRGLILRLLVTLLSLCLTTGAAHIPHNEQHQKRGISKCDKTCSRQDVAPIVKIFKRHPAQASQVCAELLPATVTITTQTTVKATPASNTLAGTVKQGTSVVVVSATTTQTSVQTITATVPSTVFITVTQIPTTITETKFATSTAPIPNTVTVTINNAAPEFKRDLASTIGDDHPEFPEELRSIVVDLATIACPCFSKATRATTVTVTNTIVEPATVTPASTPAATVPTAIETSTDVSTVTKTISETITVTNVVHATQTNFFTPTTTITQTSTVTPPAPTQTVYVSVPYTQISLPRNDCVYNQNYGYHSASIDPTNNYQKGTRQCEAMCTADSKCKFFYFFHIDPAKARGYEDAFCELVDTPYNSAFLQCGYVSDYSTAWSKNIQ
ncbi:unnamed protein product [Clonostachys rosea]|uniref:Apple domain-containing protein n=1 Tax=Bionectria ochroleuca TaxID=29856 RepID=A0ABY6UK89_BIOOC|nr:unnamed protein product [Clonostachys rosea]